MSYLDNYKKTSSQICRQRCEFRETSKLYFSKKLVEKTINNVIFGKLQRFEQSCLEARFSTPESTLTAPNNRAKNSTLIENYIFHFFENIKTKTSYLENYKDI